MQRTPAPYFMNGQSERPRKRFAYESPIEELYYDRSVVPMGKPPGKMEIEAMIQAAVEQTNTGGNLDSRIFADINLRGPIKEAMVLGDFRTFPQLFERAARMQRSIKDGSITFLRKSSNGGEGRPKNTLRTQQPTQEVTITPDQINSVQAQQNAQRQQSTRNQQAIQGARKAISLPRDKPLPWPPGLDYFKICPFRRYAGHTIEECHTLRDVIYDMND